MFRISSLALIIASISFGQALNSQLQATTGVPLNGNVDALGTAQYNFPAGFVRTSDEPHQVFYDPFDSSPDTTNMWTSATGNSAVAASVTTGVMSMGTGTTASGWSKFYSIPTFKLPIPAWMGFSFAIALPDGASPTANSYRFWGAGTPATTPSTAAPLTDAVGFEITTGGKMIAVVYNNGTRTAVQDLSASTGNSKQPTNTSYHRYIVYVRTDKAYWYIDGLSANNLVATSDFQSPATQTLPITMLAVGGSTPPVSNTQIQCTGAVVWDTGKNASKLADGTYPWRTAAVGSTGALSNNLTQVNGNSVSTSATGVQKVGVVGNAGATVDSTVGAGTAPTNAVITGTVFNSTAPAPTAGQAMAHQADEAGNLRVAKGIALKTLSAWTSATALNATQTIFANSGAESVVVQLVQTSTLTAGAVTFEATFDGSNWVSIPATTVLDPTSMGAQISLPYTVQASTNKPFLILSNGWQGLRVKLSTQITGTGSVTPNYALLNYKPMSYISIVDGAGQVANIATNALKIAVNDAFGNGINSTSNALNTNDAATSSTGSAVPAKGDYIAGNAGGNLTGLTVCNSSAQLQMTTATTTQIVGLVSSQKVRVCGYQIQGSTTATATTLKFVYGTGSNCGTGTTNITPAWNLTASNTSMPQVVGSGIGELFSTAASNALCATNSAAGTVNIFVTYTQY